MSIHSKLPIPYPKILQYSVYCFPSFQAGHISLQERRPFPTAAVATAVESTQRCFLSGWVTNILLLLPSKSHQLCSSAKCTCTRSKNRTILNVSFPKEGKKHPIDNNKQLTFYQIDYSFSGKGK